MPPKFRDLKKYCENTGWVLNRDTDHWYYEKVVTSGDVLKTRISHALAKEISGNLWKKILKHQLKTTESEFWSKL